MANAPKIAVAAVLVCAELGYQFLIAEQKLIAKFRTHEDGLNRDLGFMSHYL